ncbi:MAG: polyhydroxyalkanoate depolymerase [Alphaproteobacteria bacterium]
MLLSGIVALHCTAGGGFITGDDGREDRAMMYQFYEAAQMALTPARYVAGATQMMLQNPLLPMAWSTHGRAIAAQAELFERLTRSFKKPDFGLLETTLRSGRTVAVEEEIVDVKPFCNLLHFKRRTRQRDPQVLVVAPMSGHYATLLRGTVEALLPDHDVYITDWNDAKQVSLAYGRFDLDTYVDYLIDYMHLLGPDTHIIAVCQPAVPVMAAVSLLAAANDPDQPKSMTLMGGPIDTTAAHTEVSKLALDKPLSWFEHSVVDRVPVYYPGAMRRVYPGFLQLTGFMSMNLDRHIGAHLSLFRHLIQGDGDSADRHRAFYDEYLSVMDLPAEFYLQTLEVVFMDHKLPKGTWVWNGQKVDPSAITKTALMTVEGEKDDISAPGQTYAAHGLLSNLDESKKAHILQEGVGHYGIFNGRRWREKIKPQIAEFIREQS